MISALSQNLFDIIFFFVRDLTLQKIVLFMVKRKHRIDTKRPRTTISLMDPDREIAPFKSTKSLWIEANQYTHSQFAGQVKLARTRENTKSGVTYAI